MYYSLNEENYNIGLNAEAARDFKLWIGGDEKKYDIHIKVLSGDIDVTKYFGDFIIGEYYRTKVSGIREFDEYIRKMKKEDIKHLVDNKVIGIDGNSFSRYWEALNDSVKKMNEEDINYLISDNVISANYSINWAGLNNYIKKMNNPAVYNHGFLARDFFNLEQFNAYIREMPEDMKYLLNNKAIFDDDHFWSPKSRLLVKMSFYWEQTFSAEKRVHIKHTYSPSVRNNAGGNIAGEYILKTANTWNKPIRNFNLFVAGIMDFEDNVYFSTKGYVAKNIKNFSPAYDLNFDLGPISYVNVDTGKGYAAKSIKYMLYNSDGRRENKGYTIDVHYYSDNKGNTRWKNRDTKEDVEVIRVPEKDYSNTKLYMIDGPAKVRANPNGKEVAVLDNGVYVWVISNKDDWYEIAYNDLAGWTHKQNIIDPRDVKKFNNNVKSENKKKVK